MSEVEATVVPLHAETEFEKLVLRMLQDMRAEDERRWASLRSAVETLTEEVVRTRRDLENRIDGHRIDSEVLEQAAEGARRDAEKALRECQRLARQRDDARRFAGLDDTHTNGNGHYSSAPPPPKDA